MGKEHQSVIEMFLRPAEKALKAPTARHWILKEVLNITFIFLLLLPFVFVTISTNLLLLLYRKEQLFTGVWRSKWLLAK